MISQITHASATRSTLKRQIYLIKAINYNTYHHLILWMRSFLSICWLKFDLRLKLLYIKRLLGVKRRQQVWLRRPGRLVHTHISITLNWWSAVKSQFRKFKNKFICIYKSLVLNIASRWKTLTERKQVYEYL